MRSLSRTCFGATPRVGYLQGIVKFLFFSIFQFYTVIATGLEPVTVCLEGRCSIQLSYATLLLSCLANLSRLWRMAGCGEEGIRTPGTRNEYNSLAGSPDRPLWHLSRSKKNLIGVFSRVQM